MRRVMRRRSTPAFAAVLACLAATPVKGQQLDPALDASVERHAERIIDIRHDIHRNPELGNREHRTAELVAGHLRDLGLEVRTAIAHTGVVGVLRGARPGPTIAVRADMDALPVTESTGYPFASMVRTEYGGQDVGVSHACGHDIHTAVQLGVASVLADLRDRVGGTVLFIFQPAEEGAPPGEQGGAELMLREGVFDDPTPEAILGLHTFSQMEVGTVGYTPGPALAAADRWTVRLRGRQSHAASPHMAVDPIVMAAEAVMALQTIRSRNMDPLDPGVVTVGILRAGERNNIIPMEAYLEGTVRTFDPAVQDLVERRLAQIFRGVAAIHGGGSEFHYERGVPVTVNDERLTRWAAPVLERVMGSGAVQRIEPTTGAEDFAFFANEIPGFYFRLGTVAPGTTSGDHHTPTFRADDSAVPVGMRVMTALVLDYLEDGSGPAPD